MTASDSRTSRIYSDGTSSFDRDDFQKTFASPATPDIFAVCGRVQGVPSLISDLFCAAGEDRARMSGTAVADGYTERLLQRISNTASFAGLVLFHGFRFNVNDFGLTRIELGPQPRLTRIILTPRSGLLYRDGSGESMVQRTQLNDPETDAKGFSRWYWQSFVLSLNPSSDASCGGAPQLVGLFQKGPGISFGVRFNGTTYLNGSVSADTSLSEVRDELFQRVSSSGELLKKAQQHARNFPRDRLFG